jgi:IS605 OrfB family transposase
MNSSNVFASIDTVTNPITPLPLSRAGVQTLVIGDVRDIRQDNDVGSTNNQKIHQWSHGQVRHLLTYKAERLGMAVALQDEHYTSRLHVVNIVYLQHEYTRIYNHPHMGANLTDAQAHCCHDQRKYGQSHG